MLSAAAILACSQPSARDPDRPAPTSTEPTTASVPAAPESAPETAPPPPADAPPRAQDEKASLDRDALLAAHNGYRERHCAPPLAWSEHLADIAEQWADVLLSRDCALEHSEHRYGENLAAGTAGALDAERVVALWYDEIELYEFDDPGFAFETGHFTQVVWAETDELGCAVASCPGMDLWVCNYAPPGNVLDAFEDNVLPDSCER